MVESFEVKIYVGLREGYKGELHTVEEAEEICQEYCNEVGLCVTVTPTTYVYTNTKRTPNSKEPGVIVGLINYPRFPLTQYDIIDHAQKLAKRLLEEFKQTRITITTPKRSYLVQVDTSKTSTNQNVQFN